MKKCKKHFNTSTLSSQIVSKVVLLGGLSLRTKDDVIIKYFGNYYHCVSYQLSCRNPMPQFIKYLRWTCGSQGDIGWRYGSI